MPRRLLLPSGSQEFLSLAQTRMQLSFVPMTCVSRGMEKSTREHSFSSTMEKSGSTFGTLHLQHWHSRWTLHSTLARLLGLCTGSTLLPVLLCSSQSVVLLSLPNDFLSLRTSSQIDRECCCRRA